MIHGKWNLLSGQTIVEEFYNFHWCDKAYAYYKSITPYNKDLNSLNFKKSSEYYFRLSEAGGIDANV